MSIVYQWPIAFLKHWVLPISYVVGLTYDGQRLNPVRSEFSANFYAGRITALAWFEYPVMAMYGFSYLRGYYTDPIVVFLDYPALGVYLEINIRP
jgi:hypothetical protein